MEEKLRLDVAIVNHKLAPSREKAKMFIKQSKVFVNGKRTDKPSAFVSPDDIIEVRGETLKYVSRGGLKLEKAIDSFHISLKDLVCADIGASTGGFTDCMLQHGAKKVYAVDVGCNQLSDVLRNDKRVINLEHCNFRYITDEQINEKLDFISVDVSFISLSYILPSMQNRLKDDGIAVCLIKPQFEAGRENIGKNGVVKDKRVHLAVLKKIIGLLSLNHFSLLGLDFSPIKGPEGNIEYLCYIKKSNDPNIASGIEPDKIVESSHLLLKGAEK